MLKVIKKFFTKIYLRFVRAFRHYSRRFSVTIRTPFAIVSIMGFVLYLSLSYYGIDLLITLINDEEVASVINLNYTVALLLFLAASLYANLVLLIKIFLDRIRRSPGTLIRFRVIGFFFLAIIIPALLFIYVFDIFFDRSIAIFDNQAILRNMENKRWQLTQEIEKLTDQVNARFEVQKTNEFRYFNERGLTFVGVYGLNGKRLFHLKKNSFSLQRVPNYSFETYLSEKQTMYSSYSMEEGFIFQIRKENFRNGEYYFVVISEVPNYLMNDISETFAVIRQLKQFELLLYPFKLFTIIFLLYVYLQIFSILAIIFYYSSNRYITPLAALIKSTKKIIQGDYKLSLLRYTRYMSNNEIKQLLESFSKMSRELINSRQRLERLSSIEAWKDVSRKLAHEIKNPLTPIILATNKIEKQLIKSDLAAYDAHKENFRFIESEVARILNLLNEFNILAKQEFIELRPVPTERLTRKVSDLMLQYNDITLEVEDHYQNEIMIDEEKIISVLLNLVQNSIDSLKEVKEELPDYSAQIKFKIFIEEVSEQDRDKLKLKNLIFEVWDNGKGIPPEVSNEVFKPYVTFKDQGTGLGLAICEEIISLHQGAIDHYQVQVHNGVVVTSEAGETLPEEIIPKEQVMNDAGNGDNNQFQFDKKSENNWTVFRIVIPIKSS